MGNNIYETPRNKAKWKTQNNLKKKKPIKNNKEDNTEKLMRLKLRLDKQKNSSL